MTTTEGTGALKTPPTSATGSGAHSKAPVSEEGPTSLRSAVGRLLLVDDDATLRRSVGRALRARGFEVKTAENGHLAVEHVRTEEFDVILSDIGMPGMDGIQLLREVRKYDLHVPVVLITGEPAVSTAVQALEYGAFHYLTKPASTADITKVMDKAVRMHRMARVRQQAAELLGGAGAQARDRAGLEAGFARAMAGLWVAYHPIVNVTERHVFGHEALLRSCEPSLPHPGAVVGAAEKLGELQTLGRTIRDRATEPYADDDGRGLLFVNLHPTDLGDPSLTDPDMPLSQIATRVVLEITERSSLDDIHDVRARVAALRDLGFRIAVDDLGAGYAGLTSFAQLEPEIVKLDMSLIRDIHQSSTKQKVVRSMAGLAQDMGMLVVAEGVETTEERDTLIGLGCDLLQGFFFARPGPPFPEVSW